MTIHFRYEHRGTPYSELIQHLATLLERHVREAVAAGHAPSVWVHVDERDGSITCSEHVTLPHHWTAFRSVKPSDPYASYPGLLYQTLFAAPLRCAL